MLFNKLYLYQKRFTRFQVIVSVLAVFGVIGFVSSAWHSEPATTVINLDTVESPIDHQSSLASTESTGDESSAFDVSALPAEEPAAIKDQSYVIQSGDTLEAIFKRMSLSITELQALLEADEPYLLLDILKPGDELNFRIDRTANSLDALSLVIDPSKTVIYRHGETGFSYTEVLTPTAKIAEVTRGEINGSFYLSAASAGLTDNHVMTITQLLKRSLNFNRDLRAGDRFEVVLERETIDSKPIGKDRLLAARIYTGGKEFDAYLHSDGSYYNAKGQSLMPALLRFPTKKKFAISSHFNPRRRHPVTGRIAPHNGVDLATPTGTPVLSTGNGRVTRVASHRYAGKYIDIDEFGPYSTRFLHLSKILVKKGQLVERGQVIALSGNTGRSTGPHLHYELHYKGRPVNPVTTEIPKLRSIPDKELKAFNLQVAEMQDLMLSEERVVYLDKTPEDDIKQAKVNTKEKLNASLSNS
jgi:murein DD-endopeptidase